MEKVIRNGMVAVLVSYGYGAGWYSWHGEEALLYHPKLVELVESKQHHLITEELVKGILNTEEYVCVLGAKGLVVEWVKQGCAFEITEYDGSEDLRVIEECEFLVA